MPSSVRGPIVAAAQSREVVYCGDEGRPPNEARRRRWILPWRRLEHRKVLEWVLVAVAYFLAGRLAFAVPLTNGNVAPVWPAAGIALGALVARGSSVWSMTAIAVGAFFVNLFSPIPHLAALGIALGNTAGPAVGAWLLRRAPGFQIALTRFRGVLALVIFGALGGTAITATVGTSVLFAAGVHPWSHYGAAWLMWCLGDAIGILIIVPVVFAFPKLLTLCRKRLFELVTLVLGVSITSLLIFHSSISLVVGAEILVLGLVPFMLWSAMRFEVAGTATANVLIAAIAVWETGHGMGPLAKTSPLWSAALLQSFLGFIIVPGMALAAVVTERAQIVREQAARDSERRYGGILESAHEGIWMLDAQFRTKFVNHRMAALLGYSVDEMIGRPLFDFLFPEDVERKRRVLEQCRRGDSDQIEGRYRKKDGSEFWATLSRAPIVSPEGQFEGVVKWFTLDDQRRSDTEKRSTVEMLMLLSRAVQQTTDSIMITDNNGVIEYVNPAFEAVTGFTQEEALGKTPRIVKSGRYGTEFYKQLWECISGGQPFHGTLINRKKTGELYWGEQTITPILDDQGKVTHFVSVVRDITDSRQKQEQEVQLRLAREVQQRFYAPAASVPGLDIAAAACPANETGGDYFDTIVVPDNSVYVAIGDISGHGLGSALVMALMRAYVRSFVEMQLDAGEILTRINHMLRTDLESAQFATLLLIHLKPERDTLTYANAGHVPALLLNSNGEIERVLESTGVPLGLFDNSEFACAEAPLRPEQILVLVTDGITECTDGNEQEFGSMGVVEHMRAHCEESANRIAEGLCAAARAFTENGPQCDDLTAVVLKVLSRNIGAQRR